MEDGNGTLYVGVFPDHFKVIDEATGTITGKVPFTAGMPRRTALSRDRSRFYTVEAQMEKVDAIVAAGTETPVLLHAAQEALGMAAAQ